MKSSKLNPLALLGHRIPSPTAEFKFHPIRKWRADYCWQDAMLIVELEGGVFIAGRHSRGLGMIKDMEKYNAAIELGYVVLRYSPTHIDYAQIKRVYDMRHNGINKL